GRASIRREAAVREREPREPPRRSLGAAWPSLRWRWPAWGRRSSERARGPPDCSSPWRTDAPLAPTGSLFLNRLLASPASLPLRRGTRAQAPTRGYLAASEPCVRLLENRVRNLSWQIKPNNEVPGASRDLWSSGAPHKGIVEDDSGRAAGAHTDEIHGHSRSLFHETDVPARRVG